MPSLEEVRRKFDLLNVGDTFSLRSGGLFEMIGHDDEAKYKHEFAAKCLIKTPCGTPADYLMEACWFYRATLRMTGGEKELEIDLSTVKRAAVVAKEPEQATPYWTITDA